MRRGKLRRVKDTRFVVWFDLRCFVKPKSKLNTLMYSFYLLTKDYTCAASLIEIEVSKMEEYFKRLEPQRRVFVHHYPDSETSEVEKVAWERQCPDRTLVEMKSMETDFSYELYTYDDSPPDLLVSPHKHENGVYKNTTVWEGYATDVIGAFATAS